MQHDTLRRHSARYVIEVLRACNGNKKLACRELDITWPTLMRYLAVAQQLREDAAKAAA